jgi:hypothetical protein
VAVVDANVGVCDSVFVGQATTANPKGTVSFRPGALLTAANVLLGRDGTNFGRSAGVVDGSRRDESSSTLLSRPPGTVKHDGSGTAKGETTSPALVTL